MSAMFTDAKDALQFIMSGKAIFTIVSKKSGQRFTYRVERSGKDIKDGIADHGFRFVKLMTGPDNAASYTYMGLISNTNYSHARKSRISETAPSVVAFDWVLRLLKAGNIKADQLEIWHEGKCGKCARRLTVPASIANGIGPECAKSVYSCN